MPIIKRSLLLLFLFSVQYGFSQADSSNIKVGITKNNFKIQYPQTWRLDTSKIMGTELFIFSPLQNADDKFSENVNVMIQNLSGQQIDLKKYKEITEQQLPQFATDYKLFESSIITTEKSPYYKVVYAMTQGAFRLKIHSVCFIKNEKAYLATFSSEMDKYQQYQKTG